MPCSGPRQQWRRQEDAGNTKAAARAHGSTGEWGTGHIASSCPHAGAADGCCRSPRLLLHVHLLQSVLQGWLWLWTSWQWLLERSAAPAAGSAPPLGTREGIASTAGREARAVGPATTAKATGAILAPIAQGAPVAHVIPITQAAPIALRSSIAPQTKGTAIAPGSSIAPQTKGAPVALGTPIAPGTPQAKGAPIAPGSSIASQTKGTPRAQGALGAEGAPHSGWA